MVKRETVFLSARPWICLLPRRFCALSLPMEESPRPLIRCLHTCSLPTKVSCRHTGCYGIVLSSKANATLDLSHQIALLRHPIPKPLSRNLRRYLRLASVTLPHLQSLVRLHFPPRPRLLRLESRLLVRLRQWDLQARSVSLQSLLLVHLQRWGLRLHLASPRSLPLAHLRRWGLPVRLVSLQSLPLAPLRQWDLRVRSAR